MQRENEMTDFIVLTEKQDTERKIGSASLKVQNSNTLTSYSAVSSVIFIIVDANPTSVDL